MGVLEVAHRHLNRKQQRQAAWKKKNKIHSSRQVSTLIISPPVAMAASLTKFRIKIQDLTKVISSISEEMLGSHRRLRYRSQPRLRKTVCRQTFSMSSTISPLSLRMPLQMIWRIYSQEEVSLLHLQVSLK